MKYIFSLLVFIIGCSSTQMHITPIDPPFDPPPTSDAAAESGIKWVAPSPELEEQAVSENKTIILYIKQNGCPSCINMENNLFQEDCVVNAITKNYIPVKLNLSEEPDVITEEILNMGIDSTPTIMFIMPWGDIFPLILVGNTTSDGFCQLLDDLTELSND